MYYKSIVIHVVYFVKYKFTYKQTKGSYNRYYTNLYRQKQLDFGSKTGYNVLTKKYTNSILLFNELLSGF